MSRGVIKRLARAIVPRWARNWMRAPTRSIKWMVEAARYAFGRTIVMEPRSGWRIKCHPTFGRILESHQLHDPLQTAEFNQFINQCTPGMILVDCGAHFGLFSLAALHFGGFGATAVAIEPSPMATKILRNQAILNNVADRLMVIQACVGRESGIRSFVPAGVISGGYFVGRSGETQESELVKVPCITIDELVATMPKWPTHVKIDVEGMEEEVILGGKNLFQSNASPMIFLELHNDVILRQNEKPNRVLELLIDWGFKLLNEQGEAATIKALVSKPVTRLLARKMVT